MMKKTFLIVALLFFIAVASAYEQNSEINYKVGCEYLNCSQTYTVTVEDPDSILILDNTSTSIQNGYLNFTLNTSQTSQNGVYKIYLTGNGASPFYLSEELIVTPNGEIATEATAIFYIGLLIILIFGFGAIAYSGITSQSIILKTFAVGFGYLFLIAISFISWNMAADFITSSPFLAQFLYYLFLVLMIGFFPLIILLFVYGVYTMLTVKEIQDMMDRGISFDEASERRSWKK